METITAHALLIIGPWKREGIVHPRMSAVEGRIKAGDLHGVWEGTPRGGDAGEIVRLMKRGERNEVLKFRDNFTSQFNRFRIARPAVDYAVPDSRDPRLRKVRLDMQKRRVMGVGLVFRNEAIFKHDASAGAQDQMR